MSKKYVLQATATVVACKESILILEDEQAKILGDLVKVQEDEEIQNEADDKTVTKTRKNGKKK